MKNSHRMFSVLSLIFWILLLATWGMAALGWIPQRASPLTLIACVLGLIISVRDLRHGE